MYWFWIFKYYEKATPGHTMFSEVENLGFHQMMVVSVGIEEPLVQMHLFKKKSTINEQFG